MEDGKRKTSAARLRANKKYMDKAYFRVTVNFIKCAEPVLKAEADKRGLSLNDFIKSIVYDACGIDVSTMPKTVQVDKKDEEAEEPEPEPESVEQVSEPAYTDEELQEIRTASFLDRLNKYKSDETKQAIADGQVEKAKIRKELDEQYVDTWRAL